MQNYIIATSSTSDLTKEYLNEHNIPFISYSYSINENVYQDDCLDSSKIDVYNRMRNGDKLKTSNINTYEYYEFFSSLLKEGKDVIYLDMSQKMSSSYNNSLTAAKMAADEFPDRKLTVIDTLCISGGLGLLIQNVVKLRDNGAAYEEVINWINDNKLKIAHRFTVDDLNYLKEGGRVSNAAALVGSILNIKPVLYVPDGGTLDVVKKARGRKVALKTILDSIEADLSEVDTKGLEMVILHADCPTDAEYVRDQILEKFPDMGKIDIGILGVTIGAHCGPGLLTIFYMCNGRMT